MPEPLHLTIRTHTVEGTDSDEPQEPTSLTKKPSKINTLQEPTKKQTSTFLSLPSEIRHRIYDFALPDRIVYLHTSKYYKITLNSYFYDGRVEQDCTLYYGLISSPTPHSILHEHSLVMCCKQVYNETRLALPFQASVEMTSQGKTYAALSDRCSDTWLNRIVKVVMLYHGPRVFADVTPRIDLQNLQVLELQSRTLHISRMSKDVAAARLELFVGQVLANIWPDTAPPPCIRITAKVHLVRTCTRKYMEAEWDWNSKKLLHWDLRGKP